MEGDIIDRKLKSTEDSKTSFNGHTDTTWKKHYYVQIQYMVPPEVAGAAALELPDNHTQVIQASYSVPNKTYYGPNRIPMMILPSDPDSALPRDMLETPIEYVSRTLGFGSLFFLLGVLVVILGKMAERWNGLDTFFCVFNAFFLVLACVRV